MDETETNVELDPYFQDHANTMEEAGKFYKERELEESDAVEDQEVKAQADKFDSVGDAVRLTAETALQVPLGVGDFVSDAVGLVPWLKPIDEWWDNNSYRSTHPGHKLIRDASSIIVPTLLGGGAVVKGARAYTAARAMTCLLYTSPSPRDRG